MNSSSRRIPRGKFTISEVAHLTGVPISTLRSWAKSHRFQADRNSAGKLEYDIDAVRRIRNMAMDQGSSRSRVQDRLDYEIRETSRLNDLEPASNGLIEPSIAMPRSSLDVRIVGIGAALSAALKKNPSLLHGLSPSEFEEFVCDRLSAMGLEPKRVGNTNRKDGGVDVVFWPKAAPAFPFVGAAQVKHHKRFSQHQGPDAVRDFAGVVAGHRFNAGLIVTNTVFTPDARWLADKFNGLLRLREYEDLVRWIRGEFGHLEEWREIPKTIELAPGIVIEIP